MTGVDGGSAQDGHSESGLKLGRLVDAAVALTSPGVNGGGGPPLVIPNKEVTVTLETGLGSKRKTASTSAERNPAS